TAYSTFYGLKEVVGEETFKKIIANLTISGSSAGAYEGPARGEFAVGITMEYAASEYIEGGAKDIVAVYPADGTMTMPEGMFLIKGAKNPGPAKKLYDYLSSLQAQTDLFKKTFRRPARSDFDASKVSKLPDMKDIKIHPVDPQVSGNNREAFLKEFRALVQASR
ncbi:MAG: extracellular solute-binding protein, partial [Duodenibacillus sp.]|nr:extracellular solute-binding protein [Duodenibacillus sp.]